MLKIGAKSAKIILICHLAGMLGLGLFFFFFAGSAKFTSLPEAKPARKSITLPRNYCLANVTSLGTGLVQDSGQARTKYSTHKTRPWTGWIRASASGKYELSLPKSGGQIIVNKQQIFSRSAISSKPVIVEIELLTNRFYAITVHTHNSEDETLPLHWRRPDGRYETVPKAYLYAPLATADDSQPV